MVTAAEMVTPAPPLLRALVKKLGYFANDLTYLIPPRMPPTLPPGSPILSCILLTMLADDRDSPFVPGDGSGWWSPEMESARRGDFLHGRREYFGGRGTSAADEGAYSRPGGVVHPGQAPEAFAPGRVLQVIHGAPGTEFHAGIHLDPEPHPLRRLGHGGGDRPQADEAILPPAANQRPSGLQAMLRIAVP
jgi:hypothetical protein